MRKFLSFLIVVMFVCGSIVLAQAPASAKDAALKASANPPKVEMVSGEGKSVFTLKPYGYVKLDAIYDSQRVQNGELAFYVMPKEAGELDDEFNMTARETRLGLDLAGPDTPDIKTTGKVEVDFYGSGGAPNTAPLRMRLAYLDVAMPKGFSIRAGQDWETFITVIPRILNFSYLADAGALGLRRPQFRLTQEIPIQGQTKVVAKVAAARTIGEDIDGGGQDDGVDSGLPTLQYNLILEMPILTKKASKFSISGHWGRETADGVVSNSVVVSDEKDYDTYSVIGSVFLPLHERIALQGSIWTGENLDTYYGGIGQGINKTLKTEIAAVGGFAQLITDITDDINWNIGYGIDDPKDSDLNKGNRSKNQIIFSSIYYKLTKAVTAAFEYSYMKTDYKQQSNVADNRFQGAMIYKF